MNKIKFEFTIDEVNGILNGLGKAPAEISMYGIQLIQTQAGPQVDAIRKAEEEAKNESETAS